MKTCVLISGLPRNIYAGFNNINQHLIEPNNADVFIHSWLDETNDNRSARFLIENFKPKRWLFEPQKKFVNDHMELGRMMVSHGRGYERNNFVTMVYSSWYSILQANLLKEQHRLENNVEYDYVIRARFDIAYNKPVFCSSHDKNALNISNRNLVPNKGPLPPEMVDDRFAFGSNSIMNLYCNGFGMIEYLHGVRENKDGIFCGETIVYEMSRMFNLKINTLDYLIAYHI